MSEDAGPPKAEPGSAGTAGQAERNLGLDKEKDTLAWPECVQSAPEPGHKCPVEDCPLHFGPLGDQNASRLRPTFRSVWRQIWRDFKVIRERDPAAAKVSALEIVLCYPGLHAIAMHRLIHYLHVRWRIPVIPRLMSHMARILTGIDIHPGATIAEGFFIDHGMGVVIGETAVIGNNVTLFQNTTLGGTGKERGKRHPTLGEGVTVGAGAIVLGNIMVGENSYVGAGSVVVRCVPPDSTVVGVPGRIVRREGREIRGAYLDHTNLPDPILEKLHELDEEIKRFERSQAWRRQQ